MIVTNPADLKAILLQGKTPAAATKTDVRSKNAKTTEARIESIKKEKTVKATKTAAKKTPAKSAKKGAKKASAKAATKANKPQGIGAYCIAQIAEGLSNAEVFAAVQKKFPQAATSMNCIRWYRSKNFESSRA